MSTMEMLSLSTSGFVEILVLTVDGFPVITMRVKVDSRYLAVSYRHLTPLDY